MSAVRKESSGYLNKCAFCGKFKKWEDLNYREEISYSGSESEYHVCDKCDDEKSKERA